MLFFLKITKLLIEKFSFSYININCFYAIDFFIIIISYNYLKFLLSYDKEFLNILSK